VAQFGIFLLSLILPFLAIPTRTIEKSFLQNNPRIFYELLPADSRISISLPDPISFSDQVSAQQAFFLFQQIFSAYTTFEFYPEAESPYFIEEGGVILKARWSFKNNRTSDQHVLELFFYLARADLRPTGMEQTPLRIRKTRWIIAEIRAAEIKVGEP
jgi:hypothetical protein